MARGHCWSMCLQTHQVVAQSLNDVTNSKTLMEQGQNQPPTVKIPSQVGYKAYILGPGDVIKIELLDLPELSGRFEIGPEGTLCLPRVRSLYVEGLTIDERVYLTEKFKLMYVNHRCSFILWCIDRFGFMCGEVKRPGYYTPEELTQSK